MRLKCLGCEVLARPLYFSAATSPHIVDIELLQRGLHDRPAGLREALQARIDDVSTGHYDAIVLAYGLCGQAAGGLVAREIPVVIPRAHDCITLLLGSRERYRDQFERYPGTYWYALDYLERDDGSGSTLAMGAGTEEQLQNAYQEYIEKYGKDNADYLMETMGAWQRYYQRAAYIDVKVRESTAVEGAAKAQAARRGWIFERLEGDLVLLRRLLLGEWEGDFLVVSPGKEITPTVDEDIIRCSETT